jgi:membrane fusion protein, heavy metal efflux system
MKPRLASTIVLIVVLTVVGSALAFWVIHSTQKKSDPPKSNSPATVTKTVKEDDLNIITLTPEAEKRLDLRTAPIDKRKVERSRFYGGEVTLPPGRSLVVSAPFAGTIRLPASGAAPIPGRPVEKNQPLLTIVPLLTPEARTTLATQLVDAEGQVKSAQVQLEAAQIALDRAKKLFAEQAGTKRNVDDAQAQFDIAQKTLEAAIARRNVIEKTIKGVDAGSLTAITIDAPDAGILRNISVAPGQVVAAGVTLFEVMNPTIVWIKVPVYVGDIDEIAADKPAAIGKLNASNPISNRLAKPIAAPPTANPLGSTIDLFYELENEKNPLNPGQKVGVTVPLRTQEDALVVPWSAIMFDVHGGAWVYERIADHAYTRRRVQVHHVIDSTAVLTTGPPAGTNIVTQGVAELYGKEMGFGK